MVAKRGRREPTDDGGKDGQPMKKSGAMATKGGGGETSRLRIRKVRKKMKKVEDEKDRKKATARVRRFLQTVAAALIVEVGDGEEKKGSSSIGGGGPIDPGLSSKALKKALANATKELPKGRLRRTLRTNLAHFSTILAQSVAEARAGKRGAPDHDDDDEEEEKVMGREQKSSDERDVECALMKALNDEVLSNSGYRSAAMAAMSAVDIVGKKKKIRNVRAWHRAFERLFAARRPPPFLLVVAYAEFVRKVFRRAAKCSGEEGDDGVERAAVGGGGGGGSEDEMWAKFGLKRDCPAMGSVSRVVANSLRDVVVAEGVLKAVTVVVESLSGEGAAAIAALSPAVDPLRTAVGSVSKMMASNMRGTVGDGGTSSLGQMKTLRRRLTRALKALLRRVEEVIVSHKHSGGFCPPYLRIHPPSIDPVVALSGIMRKRLKTALLGYSFRESFGNDGDGGSSLGNMEGDDGDGESAGVSGLTLTKDNVMAQKLAERVAAEVFVLRIVIEVLSSGGGGGGGGEGEGEGRGSGWSHHRLQQQQQEQKHQRKGHGRDRHDKNRDPTSLCDSQEKIHSLRLLAADLFVSLFGSRCGALLDLLVVGPPCILSVLRPEDQLLVQGILYEAAINGYVNSIRSGGWGCKALKRELCLEDGGVSEYFTFILLARKAICTFRANGERSRALALATTSANAWVPPGVFYRLLAFGGEAAIALPFGMQMPATSSPADLRNLSVWLIQSASEEALETVQYLCVGEGGESSRGQKSSGARKGEDEFAGELFFIDRAGEKTEDMNISPENDAIEDCEFAKAARSMLAQASVTWNGFHPSGKELEVEGSEDEEHEEGDEDGSDKEHGAGIARKSMPGMLRPVEEEEGEGKKAMNEKFFGARKEVKKRSESTRIKQETESSEEEGEHGGEGKVVEADTMEEDEDEGGESGEGRGEGEKGIEHEEKKEFGQLRGEEENGEEDVDLVGMGETETNTNFEPGCADKPSVTEGKQHGADEEGENRDMEEVDKSGAEIEHREQCNVLSEAVGLEDPKTDGKGEDIPGRVCTVVKELGTGEKSEPGTGGKSDISPNEEGVEEMETKLSDYKRKKKGLKRHSGVVAFSEGRNIYEKGEVKDVCEVDLGVKVEDGGGWADALVDESCRSSLKKRKRSVEGERKVRQRSHTHTADGAQITSCKIENSYMVEENIIAKEEGATSGIATKLEMPVTREQTDTDHGELSTGPANLEREESQSGRKTKSSQDPAGKETAEDVAMRCEDGAEAADCTPFPLTSISKKRTSGRKSKTGRQGKMQALEGRLSKTWILEEADAGEDEDDEQDKDSAGKSNEPAISRDPAVRNLADSLLAPAAEKGCSIRVQGEERSQALGDDATTVRETEGTCAIGDTKISEQEEACNLYAIPGRQASKRSSSIKCVIEDDNAAEDEARPMDEAEDTSKLVIPLQHTSGVPADREQMDCEAAGGKTAIKGSQKSYRVEDEMGDVDGNVDHKDKEEDANVEDGNNYYGIAKPGTLARSLRTEKRAKKAESVEGASARSEGHTAVMEEEREHSVCQDSQLQEAVDLLGEGESNRKRKKSARKSRSSIGKDGPQVGGGDEEVVSKEQDVCLATPVADSTKNVEDCTGEDGNSDAGIMVTGALSTEKKKRPSKENCAKGTVACLEADMIEMNKDSENGLVQDSGAQEGTGLQEGAEVSRRRRKSARKSKSGISKDGPELEGSDVEASSMLQAVVSAARATENARSDGATRRRKSLRSDPKKASECFAQRVDAEGDAEDGLSEPCTGNVEMEVQEVLDAETQSFVMPPTEKGTRRSSKKSASKGMTAIVKAAMQEAVDMRALFLTAYTEKRESQSATKQTNEDSGLVQDVGQEEDRPLTTGVTGTADSPMKEPDQEQTTVTSDHGKSGRNGKRWGRNSVSNPLNETAVESDALTDEGGEEAMEELDGVDDAAGKEIGHGTNPGVLKSRDQPEVECGDQLLEERTLDALHGGAHDPIVGKNDNSKNSSEKHTQKKRVERGKERETATGVASGSTVKLSGEEEEEAGKACGDTPYKDREEIVVSPSARRSPRGLTPAASVEVRVSSVTLRSRGRTPTASTGRTRRRSSAAPSMSVDSEADLSVSQSVDDDHQNGMRTRSSRRKRGAAAAASSVPQEQEAEGSAEGMFHGEKEASDENAPTVTGMEKEVVLVSGTERDVDVDLSQEDGEDECRKNLNIDMETAANVDSEECQQKVSEVQGVVEKKAQETPTFISPPRTRSGLVRAASPLGETAKRRRKK